MFCSGLSISNDGFTCNDCDEDNTDPDPEFAQLKAADDGCRGRSGRPVINFATKLSNHKPHLRCSLGSSGVSPFTGLEFLE